MTSFLRVTTPSANLTYFKGSMQLIVQMGTSCSRLTTPVASLTFHFKGSMQLIVQIGTICLRFTTLLASLTFQIKGSMQPIVQMGHRQVSPHFVVKFRKDSPCFSISIISSKPDRLDIATN